MTVVIRDMVFFVVTFLVQDVSHGDTTSVPAEELVELTTLPSTISSTIVTTLRVVVDEDEDDMLKEQKKLCC